MLQEMQCCTTKGEHGWCYRSSIGISLKTNSVQCPLHCQFSNFSSNKIRVCSRLVLVGNTAGLLESLT
jgi:hypothetical protein